MVKLTFGAVLAGKKDVLLPVAADDDDDAAAAAAAGGSLDLEDGQCVDSRRSTLWCWCMCLGLGLMLAGVVVGGACLYRTYVVQDDPVYFCGVGYSETNYMEGVESEEEGRGNMAAAQQRYLEERVRVLVEEEVEFIEVPQFAESDPASIVHDFKRMLTTYLDLKINRCFIIPLNTSVVMPPRDFRDLLINIKAGTYLPQSYLVREQMVVTERLDRLDRLDNLGMFIHTMCRGRPTYRLEHRANIPGIHKREALNCHKIRHFENTFVVETQICEL